MNIRNAFVVTMGMIVITLGALAGTVGKSTPKGFTDDFDAALKEAAKSNKKVVAVFSGSDWCFWCKKLEKEYLSKSEFVEAAKKDFVLVFIDNPKDTSVLSETAKKRNRELTKKYGIKGFPTVKILDAKGDVIGEARPKGKETPKEYAAQLAREVKTGPIIKQYLGKYETGMQKMMDDAMAEFNKKGKEIEKSGKKGDEAMRAQFEMVQKKTGEMLAKLKDMRKNVDAEKVPAEIETDKKELSEKFGHMIKQMEKSMTLTFDDVKKLQIDKQKKPKAGSAKK